jgi:hypothetical protein
MAGRQRTTFQKRQKEVKRLEKQRMKAQKRAARRQEKAAQRAASQNFPSPSEFNPTQPYEAPEPAIVDSEGVQDS